MISWGLRFFPGSGDRTAVTVLAGPSLDERHDVGRLVLNTDELGDLAGRLAGSSERETELDWAREAAEKWQEMVNSPSWLRAWLSMHGLSDSAGPAAVLAAVAADYRGYWVTLGGQDAPRGSVQPDDDRYALVSDAPGVTPWPPGGYLCLIKGNNGCPGHPSKWMVCSADEPAVSGTDSNPTEEGR